MLLDLFRPWERTWAAVKNVVGSIRPTPGSASERGLSVSFANVARRRHEKCSWTYPCENCPMQGEEGQCGGFESGIECACPRDGLACCTAFACCTHACFSSGDASTHIRV